MTTHETHLGGTIQSCLLQGCEAGSVHLVYSKLREGPGHTHNGTIPRMPILNELTDN